MVDSSRSDLFFLFSLASLAIAGCDNDEGNNGTAFMPTTSPGTSGADEDDEDDEDEGKDSEDDEEDDDGGTTTGVASETVSASDASASTLPTTGASGITTDPGTGGYGSSGGYVDCTELEPPKVGPISEDCMTYESLVEQCYETNPECTEYYLAYCQQYLDMLDPACVSAYSDFWACLATFECEDFQNEETCAAEFGALETAC